MSQPKFAPITASLLARKGNAMPSTMAAFVEPPVWSADAHRAAPHSESAPLPRVFEAAPDYEPHPHDPSHARKLFVPMSHREYERLAIAAVKTGLSRHQLVRDALESYFEQLVRDMGEECRCVSGTGCANSCVRS